MSEPSARPRWSHPRHYFLAPLFPPLLVFPQICPLKRHHQRSTQRFSLKENRRRRLFILMEMENRFGRSVILKYCIWVYIKNNNNSLLIVLSTNRSLQVLITTLTYPDDPTGLHYIRYINLNVQVHLTYPRFNSLSHVTWNFNRNQQNLILVVISTVISDWRGLLNDSKSTKLITLFVLFESSLKCRRRNNTGLWKRQVAGSNALHEQIGKEM